MSNDNEKIEQINSDEIEYCDGCGKELGHGAPRYRTSEGTFCPDCYKKNLLS